MKTQLEDYRLDEIMESIHNGVMVIDREGIVTGCNLAGCSLLGLPKDHVIGKHINVLVPDSELVQVVLTGEPQTNVQQRIRDRIVLVNRTPVYRDGEIVGAVSVFEDVTKLRETVRQLDEKEKEINRFKDILEQLYDGIIMVDVNGIVTMINQTYCDFLGITIEDAIGKHCSEVVENSRMHIVAKTGQAEIGSLQRVKDHDIIVMRLPIRENGKLVGAIGKVMFTDVDQIKTLAERLNLVETKLDFYKKELKRVQGAKYSFDQIVGEGVRMREAKQLAVKVAKSRSTVLIRGESGTGKEWFAHAIHDMSSRSEWPFIRLNCAAIPADLLEAELFGYEEGAFTGAKKGGKPGKIELAQGGTLFLDEIGDMPLHMQVKLLRVLQEKEVERIGSTSMNQIDVRIIAATNRPLEEMVKKGEFREDLYYRLNVFHIHIPPLRERGDDIGLTAQFLLGRMNHELGTGVSGFHPDVLQIFELYSWPGNVREMQNCIERSVHLAERGFIKVEHIPPYLLQRVEEKEERSAYRLSEELENAEKRVIQLALNSVDGNRIKAARLLGIHRASLYRKLEKYGLV